MFGMHLGKVPVTTNFNRISLLSIGQSAVDADLELRVLGLFVCFSFVFNFIYFEGICEEICGFIFSLAVSFPLS